MQKKNEANILLTAALAEQAWPINDLLYRFTVNNGARLLGNLEWAKQLHLDRAGIQSQHSICFILPALTASHII